MTNKILMVMLILWCLFNGFLCMNLQRRQIELASTQGQILKNQAELFKGEILTAEHETALAKNFTTIAELEVRTRENVEALLIATKAQFGIDKELCDEIKAIHVVAGSASLPTEPACELNYNFVLATRGIRALK
jgi:hypothetical protein